MEAKGTLPFSKEERKEEQIGSVSGLNLYRGDHICIITDPIAVWFLLNCIRPGITFLETALYKTKQLAKI